MYSFLETLPVYVRVSQPLDVLCVVVSPDSANQLLQILAPVFLLTVKRFPVSVRGQVKIFMQTKFSLQFQFVPQVLKLYVRK